MDLGLRFDSQQTRLMASLTRCVTGWSPVVAGRLVRAGVLSACVAGVLAFGIQPAAASPDLNQRQAQETITATEAKVHVEYLASDELEGRGSGSQGGRKAAEYLSQQLSSYGIEPLGDGGTFFQEFGSGGAMRNVVGWIKGRDAELGESVVIGAHYDHLGHGGAGSLGGEGIHNGADDNASGTAAVLEVAQAFSKLAAADQPRRSIIFILFDGEERGLLGSSHFVEHSPVDIGSIVAMLNMDMVGRSNGKGVRIYGATSGSGVLEAIQESNQELELQIEFKETFMPNSDHASFYQKGVPAIEVFTGLHGDYHRPSDDIEKVDFEGIEAIARLVFATAYRVADAEGRPAFNELKGGGLEMAMEQLRAMFGDRFGGGDGDGEGFDLQKMLGDPENLRKMLEGLFGDDEDGQRRFNMPFGGGDEAPFGGGGQAPRPRLGVRILESQDVAGVIVDSVTPDSVAERAGLKAGDVIVSFNGRSVSDFPALREAVRQASGSVEVKIQRDGEDLTLDASFEKKSDAKPKRTKRVLY